MEYLSKFLDTIPEISVQYPLYERGIHNKDDIKQYLLSWTKKNSNPHTFLYNDKLYYHLAGFRKDYTYHSVWIELKTSKFIFMVSVNNDIHQIGDEYHSYDELIDAICNIYAKLWLK